LDNIKKTPLNEEHKKLAAKMVDFSGWEMPVQYKGIIEEHIAVRKKAGLFDVSHMGEIWVEGPESKKEVQRLVTADISNLKPGQISYAIMCYPDGGTVDDLLVYKIDDNSYLLVVNAGNKEKDYEWIKDNLKGDIIITDKSSQTAQIALQGPLAVEILQGITDEDISKMFNYTWKWAHIDSTKCMVSRTGYTGEDGYEIYCSPEQASKIWNLLIKEGKGEVQPVGLGARDTLRFEACMPLYGHELSKGITPLEAGLGYFVDLDGDDFIGKEALLHMKEKGISRKLAAFEMIDRGIPRADYVVEKDNKEIGYVTTGSHSPTFGKSLGLALIDSDQALIGEEIDVVLRGKRRKAKIVSKPFYKSRTVKK
jgi:aminomethyltransferase